MEFSLALFHGEIFSCIFSQFVSVYKKYTVPMAMTRNIIAFENFASRERGSPRNTKF